MNHGFSFAELVVLPGGRYPKFNFHLFTVHKLLLCPSPTFTLVVIGLTLTALLKVLSPPITADLPQSPLHCNQSRRNERNKEDQSTRNILVNNINIKSIISSVQSGSSTLGSERSLDKTMARHSRSKRTPMKPSNIKTDESNVIQIGTRVKVKFDCGEWFAGSVSKTFLGHNNAITKLRIKYDDGEEEEAAWPDPDIIPSH